MGRSPRTVAGPHESWPAESNDARWNVIVGLLLVLAAVPRVWAAIGNHGIVWPDEIYQSVEQAHRVVFGFGFIPWEFQDGARSWLFAGILAGLLKVLVVCGVRSTAVLVAAPKVLMASLSILAVYLSMRLAERIGGRNAAILAGVMAALLPPSIVFGSRALSETASAPICVGVALLLMKRDWEPAVVVAGALAGIAIFLRYQNGILAVGFLVLLVAQRRRQDALWYCAGLGVAVLAGGMLDAVTWGSPFSSFIQYARFNIIEGGSARYGVEPFGFYFATLWKTIGIASVPLLFGFVIGAEQAAGLALIVVAYGAMHMMVGHKELRFLMPILPLSMALAGIGWAGLLDGLRTRARLSARGATWVLAGCLGLAMVPRISGATFGDYGTRLGPFSQDSSIWDGNDSVNRLLMAAGQREDLCGLMLLGYTPIWTGGFTYLNRDVPVSWPRPAEAVREPGLGREGATANYVISPLELDLPTNYSEVARESGSGLSRRAGVCAGAPIWSRGFGR